MELYAIKTPIVEPGDDLALVIVESVKRAGFELADDDVLVVAESVVATAQGRRVSLSSITDVSSEAHALASRYSLDPRLAELILQESDGVVGGLPGVVLAIVHGFLIANAGIDASNAGGGDNVVLLPREPQCEADGLRSRVEQATGASIGVILADSRVLPLRRGVVGIAIATSGIEAVEDCRGRLDLFGRPLKITFRAVADDIATAAQLLLGEANEQTPVVLVRGAPVKHSEMDQSSVATLTPEECLYFAAFRDPWA
ncbi:MAG: coenzyme F420-0:L-glutamate ligase [Promethearchaeota archaeon]